MVWSWIVGLSAGTIFGIYVAQNYQVPDIAALFGKTREVVTSYEIPKKQESNPPPQDGNSEKNK